MFKIFIYVLYNVYKIFYLLKKNLYDIYLDFNFIYEFYIVFVNGYYYLVLQNKFIVYVDDLIFSFGCGIYQKIYFVC